MSLTSKVAIITGGSRGIGRAFALRFAREGARVAIVATNRVYIDEVVTEIAKNGGEAIGIQGDVSSEADVARMVKETKDKFQRIDILVNNAAVVLPYRTVVELTLKEWNWVIGVNLTGMFLCARAVLPQMIEQRFGKIINMSSQGGRSGAPGKCPYRPTKAAIINFTECLAAEVYQYGIDVNAILPSLVVTDGMKKSWGGAVPPVVTPIEQIADLAVFLVSEESKAITGTAINAYGASNALFGVRTVVPPPEKEADSRTRKK